MSKCDDCKYAIWDLETYFNTAQRQYFVSGCKDDEAFMVEENGEVVECNRYKRCEE